MKLINTSLGLLYSKLTGAPFYIRFHLTFRCNYRCKMCGQNHDPHQQDGELPLAQLHVVAERIAKLHARHLVNTGGDPFLRPDLPEVIAAFKRRHLSTDCHGSFYGEYRKPLYALWDFSVFREWVLDWYRTFRHGMNFKKAT